jgi:hypothetical protein
MKWLDTIIIEGAPIAGAPFTVLDGFGLRVGRRRNRSSPTV